MEGNRTSEWKYLGEITKIISNWVSIICEKWEDHSNNELIYWRVEKAHSFIIIPIYKDNILIPYSQFRPGVKETTVDLPGGRWVNESELNKTIHNILEGELKISQNSIIKTEIINKGGWIINSSFSNQLLFGVVVSLDENLKLNNQYIHKKIKYLDTNNLYAFIRSLKCLQCKAILQHFLITKIL